MDSVSSDYRIAARHLAVSSLRWEIQLQVVGQRLGFCGAELRELRLEEIRQGLNREVDLAAQGK